MSDVWGGKIWRLSPCDPDSTGGGWLEEVEVFNKIVTVISSGPLLFSLRKRLLAAKLLVFCREGKWHPADEGALHK